MYHSSASPYLIFPTGEDENIRSLVLRMYQENDYQRRYYGSFMTTYFHELMLLLLRYYEMDAIVPSPMDTKLNGQIVAILNYMHVNYNHVTIKELAAFFNYSENYLSKCLKNIPGDIFFPDQFHTDEKCRPVFRTDRDVHSADQPGSGLF